MIDIINRVEDLAFVITNESINTTDVRCNSQIKDSYSHVNILATVTEIQLEGILAYLRNTFNEAGRELEVITIKNSYHIKENINIYVVWS